MKVVRLLFINKLRLIRQNQIINSQSILLVSLLLLFLISCKQPTDKPETKVVKLRTKLIELSKGNINEIEGKTAPEESYILLYGYSQPSELKQLPISESLRRKLEDIFPPQSYEVYVLAHTSQDTILEYTQWECGGFQSHPLIGPTPFLIQGDPYKITKKQDGYSIIIELEH
jgi:hypothetical protein